MARARVATIETPDGPAELPKDQFAVTPERLFFRHKVSPYLGRELFGLPPGEGRISRASFLACLHPEDRPRVEAAMRACVEHRLGGASLEGRSVAGRETRQQSEEKRQDGARDRRLDRNDPHVGTHLGAQMARGRKTRPGREAAVGCSGRRRRCRGGALRRPLKQRTKHQPAPRCRVLVKAPGPPFT